MRAEEIKDAETLQAWLESLPQKTEEERETARRWAVTIAHRAAMRVLPVAWDWQSENMQSVTEVEFVAFLRCLSTVHARLDWKDERKKSLLCKEAAGSLRKRIANKVKVFHGHAIQAAFYSCLAGAGADSPGSDVVDACLAAVDLYEKVLNDIGLVEDVFALEDMWDAGGAWEAVRTDCAILSKWSDLDWSPLWLLKRQRVQAWENTKSKILAQGEGWRFWVEWYENALYGRPQDYDLLTKIALIDPADWDKGADHVNALIQRILAEHKPTPTPKAPPAREVVERVKASVPVNAATLALQLHSLLETIVQEREHLRGLNAFSADEKQGLHDALDSLESAARHLLQLLPEQTALTEQAAEDIASWAVVLKDQAQHWNVEAKRVVAGKPADDRVAFAGRLVFAAAVATPLSLMGLGSFAAVAGGAILLKDKLDVQKAKDAIRSVTSSQ